MPPTSCSTIYGGMPARPPTRTPSSTTLDEQFPQEVDWQVAKDSVAVRRQPELRGVHAQVQRDARRAGSTYETRWVTDAGLDMDAEIAALEAELQAVWDAFAVSRKTARHAKAANRDDRGRVSAAVLR